MRLFTNRMTDAAANRIANFGLEQMGFYNSEKEVDANFVKEYLVQVVKDYDDLIMSEKKRSMIQGVVGTLGVVALVKYVKDINKEEE